MFVILYACVHTHTVISSPYHMVLTPDDKRTMESFEVDVCVRGYHIWSAVKGGVTMCPRAWKYNQFLHCTLHHNLMYTELIKFAKKSHLQNAQLNSPQIFLAIYYLTCNVVWKISQTNLITQVTHLFL